MPEEAKASDSRSAASPRTAAATMIQAAFKRKFTKKLAKKKEAKKEQEE